ISLQIEVVPAPDGPLITRSLPDSFVIPTLCQLPGTLPAGGAQGPAATGQRGTRRASSTSGIARPAVASHMIPAASARYGAPITRGRTVHCAMNIAAMAPAATRDQRARQV